jgi:hypothetical protein
MANTLERLKNLLEQKNNQFQIPKQGPHPVFLLIKKPFDAVCKNSFQR